MSHLGNPGFVTENPTPPFSCPEKSSVNVLRSQPLSSILSCVQLATHPTEYGCSLPQYSDTHQMGV